MVSYDVIIAPKALEQLQSYVDYAQYTLLNSQAAAAIWQDAVDTQKKLSCVAGSLTYCAHPKLKKLGYRMIMFIRHSYLMLYRIEGSSVYVDGIYHERQDYENIFLNQGAALAKKENVVGYADRE